MSYTLLLGDCVEVMRTLPANSVQCCVTSPPYFGLRDYGTATWEGGDAACDHISTIQRRRDSPGGFQNSTSRGTQPSTVAVEQQYRDLCGKCGARRIDQQIGLEETPELFVAKLVEVFREVRRVLHPTGTVWLNLGDSYNGSGGYYPDSPSNLAGSLSSRQDAGSGAKRQGATRINGLKPKDLIGIPWMVAFALRADGWWLRSEIIWHKKAPMPESVTDRPTKAHEQVFLLTKQASYYYDAEAIREQGSEDSHGGGRYDTVHSTQTVHGAQSHRGLLSTVPAGATGRNKRSVWTLGPESYPGAHFAVMPTKLVEPCILAGTSAHGCCAACGAPWERVVERHTEPRPTSGPLRGGKSHKYVNGGLTSDMGTLAQATMTTSTTVDWQPTCTCHAAVVPCTVLDPFNGSGTTGAVALKHGRNYVGIDLNADYLELAHDRIRRSQPMLLSITP